MAKKKKSRNKKYNPRNKYADKRKLIEKINDLMPVSDDFTRDVVLSILLRADYLKTIQHPRNPEDQKSLRLFIRHAVKPRHLCRRYKALPIEK